MLETTVLVMCVIALFVFVVSSIMGMVVLSWYWVTFKPMFDAMKKGIDELEEL